MVAEDSGLEVDAMNGEPGVHSARFMGASTPYPDRFQEIFRRIEGRDRSARFVTALVVARAGEILFETEATVEGEIAREAAGEHGFGYDPIFYYPPYGRTLADVTEEEKLLVAHRGVAFRAFEQWLTTAVQTKNGEQ